MRRSGLLALAAVTALSIGTAASARDAPATLTQAEREYADWLDATSAVSTIDSGLMLRVGGRDRAQWDGRRRLYRASFGYGPG